MLLLTLCQWNICIHSIYSTQQITPSNTARNLGGFLNNQLSFSPHIGHQEYPDISFHGGDSGACSVSCHLEFKLLSTTRSWQIWANSMISQILPHHLIASSFLWLSLAADIRFKTIIFAHKAKNVPTKYFKALISFKVLAWLDWNRLSDKILFCSGTQTVEWTSGLSAHCLSSKKTKDLSELTFLLKESFVLCVFFPCCTNLLQWDFSLMT